MEGSVGDTSSTKVPSGSTVANLNIAKASSLGSGETVTSLGGDVLVAGN